MDNVEKTFPFPGIKQRLSGHPTCIIHTQTHTTVIIVKSETGTRKHKHRLHHFKIYFFRVTLDHIHLSDNQSLFTAYNI